MTTKNFNNSGSKIIKTCYLPFANIKLSFQIQLNYKVHFKSKYYDLPYLFADIGLTSLSIVDLLVLTFMRRLVSFFNVQPSFTSIRSIHV